MFRIGRTIPPAASPIYLRDILNGLRGMVRGSSEVERFKNELIAHFGIKNVFTVSSGRAALAVILMALHKLHPDRKDVLIPAFCCHSVPSAIVRAGLKVKLCDVDPDTLDFNHNELDQILKEYSEISRNAKNTIITKKGTHAGRLLAVVPVHLFGLAANVEKVRKMVMDPAVMVVEDAAQVMGSKLKGLKLGTLGDAGIFSLGRSKTISTVEGGVIVTARDDIADAIETVYSTLPGYENLAQLILILKALALYIFQRPSFFWFPKRLPFLRVGDTIYDPDFKIRSLSGFQSGLSASWEKKIIGFNDLRRNAAAIWSQRLLKTGFKQYASKNSGKPNFIRFPVLIDDATSWQNILDYSETNGLGIMLTYPYAVSSIPELRDEFVGIRFPVAETLTRTLLTIPVHPMLTDRDKKKTCSFLSRLSRCALTVSSAASNR